MIESEVIGKSKASRVGKIKVSSRRCESSSLLGKADAGVPAF